MRGFIVAYHANTGKEAWRFYTIPKPGEPLVGNLDRTRLGDRRRRHLGNRLL